MIMKTMKITDHNKKRKVNNTRMEEGETLTGYGTIFFVNPQDIGDNDNENDEDYKS